tara:strand:- start:327 stop:593 length:267 start_codon:yes stop_codon:yes gene_type:complete
VVEQLLAQVVAVVVLIVRLQETLVDQVVVAVITNQEHLEPQTKDMLVQMHTLMLTQVVVVLVLLLSKHLMLPQGQVRQEPLEVLVFRF